jgi:serine/threonine protein phosphatase 1
MSKWRPAPECIYVIPDIHGKFHELSLILARITPLRSGDKIIFLGDYIDRGPYSDKVLDKLISLKEKYGDDIITLKGNHEWLLLASLGKEKFVPSLPGTPTPYAVWMRNGGTNTISSYLLRQNREIKDIFTVSSNFVSKLIPNEHIDFLLNLSFYYETEDYIFVHAGCDPFIPMNNQDDGLFLWDRSLYECVVRLKSKGIESSWKKTIICGHAANGPFIADNYIMLDGSISKKLYVLELNSMKISYAKVNSKSLFPWRPK